MGNRHEHTVQREKNEMTYGTSNLTHKRKQSENYTRIISWTLRQ